MIGRYLYSVLFLLLFSLGGHSQDIQIFKVGDFDLMGQVKTCMIITHYGKELFEFNKDGFLVKTVTQYNDIDQDITYYRYNDSILLEKRMESYKDNVLDTATSMANFYSLDTTSGNRKIIEKIISYDKEFLEQQEYEYGVDKKLQKITTSNEGGVDETKIEHVSYKNEYTCSTYMNGILEKSVRTSTRKGPNGTQKVVLTKEFIDGAPNKATESIYNESGKLLSEESFVHNEGKKEFVSEKKELHVYDTNGMRVKTVYQTENAKSVKEYIYQFDDSLVKNWVKQIITPDNTYVTRKISYYPKGDEEAVAN